MIDKKILDDLDEILVFRSDSFTDIDQRYVESNYKGNGIDVRLWLLRYYYLDQLFDGYNNYNHQQIYEYLSDDEKYLGLEEMFSKLTDSNKMEYLSDLVKNQKIYNLQSFRYYISSVVDDKTEGGIGHTYGDGDFVVAILGLDKIHVYLNKNSGLMRYDFNLRELSIIDDKLPFGKRVNFKYSDLPPINGLMYSDLLDWVDGVYGFFYEKAKELYTNRE